MTNYQLWGFTYLNDEERDGINAITNSFEEADCEHDIVCFDGFAYFSFHGHYYIGRYPTLESLTDEQKQKVKSYCGYEPEDGEFGVVMGALGEIDGIPEARYEYDVSQLDVPEDVREILIGS